MDKSSSQDEVVIANMLSEMVEAIERAEIDDVSQPSTSNQHTEPAMTKRKVRFRRDVDVEVLEYKLANRNRLPSVYPGEPFEHTTSQLKKPSDQSYKYPPLIDIPLIKSVAEQAESRRIADLPDLSIQPSDDRGCGEICDEICSNCKCQHNHLYCDPRNGCRCRPDRCQNRKARRDMNLMRRRMAEANERLADESVADISTIKSIGSEESLADEIVEAANSSDLDEDISPLMDYLLKEVDEKEKIEKFGPYRRNDFEWQFEKEHTGKECQEEVENFDEESSSTNAVADDCTSELMVDIVRRFWRMRIGRRLGVRQVARVLIKRKADEEIHIVERKRRRTDVDGVVAVEGELNLRVLVDRDDDQSFDDFESIRSVSSFNQEDFDIDEINHQNDLEDDLQDGDEERPVADVEDSDAESLDTLATAIELRRSTRIRRAPERWGYDIYHFPKSRRTLRRKKASANRPTGPRIRRVAAPPPPPTPVVKVPRQLPFSCRNIPAPIRQSAPAAISISDATTAPASMAEFEDEMVACKAMFDRFDWGTAQLDILLAIQKFEKNVSSVGAAPTALQVKRLTNALIRIRSMLAIED